MFCRSSQSNKLGLISLIVLACSFGAEDVALVDMMRASGMTRREAILTAGPVRLRPILMTTAATVYPRLRRIMRNAVQIVLALGQDVDGVLRPVQRRPRDLRHARVELREEIALAARVHDVDAGGDDRAGIRGGQGRGRENRSAH